MCMKHTSVWSTRNDISWSQSHCSLCVERCLSILGPVSIRCSLVACAFVPSWHATQTMNLLVHTTWVTPLSKTKIHFLCGASQGNKGTSHKETACGYRAFKRLFLLLLVSDGEERKSNRLTHTLTPWQSFRPYRWPFYILHVKWQKFPSFFTTKLHTYSSYCAGMQCACVTDCKYR